MTPFKSAIGHWPLVIGSWPALLGRNELTGGRRTGGPGAPLLHPRRHHIVAPMPDVPVPSSTRPPLLRGLAAWLRRGYDAELLAVAPAANEDGTPLVWDFPRPVNRSRAWALLRPWFLYPAIFAVGAMAIPFIVRTHAPDLRELGGRLLWVGI